MKRILGALVIGFLAIIILGHSQPVQAAADQCFCYSELSKLNPADTEQKDFADNLVGSCNFKSAQKGCADILKEKKAQFPSRLYLVCDPEAYESEVCTKKREDWNQQKTTKLKEVKNFKEGSKFSGSVIPPCLFEETLPQPCRDISLFVTLLINFARSSLGIIGAFALAYFIYGGFILILSQGNPEKIKKGTDTMLAAIIGLFIIFAAYLLIRFVGEALGIRSEFRLL